MEFDKSAQAPFKMIKEVSNIDKGLDFFAKHKEPFVVRNAKEFTLSINKLEQLFAREPSVLSWYETEEELFNESYSPGKELLDDWKNGNLRYNIVDAPNEHLDLLPKNLLKNVGNLTEKGRDYAMCYALTKANNLTKYHEDILGDGWVYLLCGRKTWHIIPTEEIDYLASQGISLHDIKEFEFTELVQLLNNRLWGKIYITEMNAHDFIYFPQKWAHRVQTYDKSFGICGYTATQPVIDASICPIALKSEL